MQELEIQELNTEIDLRDFVKSYSSKPNIQTIQILREQKKKILESKKEFYPSYCIEWDISKAIENKDTDRAVTLIKQMQKDKGIINFTREYLNQILLTYSDMSLRTIQSRIKRILEQAQVKEGFKEYRCLCKNFNEVTYLIEDRTAILYSFI